VIANAVSHVAIAGLGYGGHSCQSVVGVGGQRIIVVAMVVRMLDNISDVNIDGDFGGHV